MGVSQTIGMFVAAAALVYVAYIAYVRTTPPVDGRLRLVLTGLRILSFGLLLFLLTDPRYILQSQKEEPPQVIALVDASASMSLPAAGWVESEGNTRFDEAHRASDVIKRIVESRGGRLVLNYFSDDLLTSVDTVTASGQGTDVRQALKTAYQKYEGENLAGVVVLSDGIDTEKRLVRGAVPPIPVYTIGVGDTSGPEDVRISEVDYNAIVRAPSRSLIKASIEYTGSGTRRIELRLTEDGHTIFEKDTLLTPGVRHLVQEIPVDFEKAGRREFSLSVDVDGYDVEKDNNRRDIIIQAEKAGVKVLIVDLLPSWELHFLTEFMVRDQTFDFDLVSSLREHPTFTKGKLRSVDGFADDLREYDALILASLNAGFLSQAVSGAIRKFVHEDGKGLLVLPGHGSLFEQSAGWDGLSDMLPVRGTPPHRFHLQYTSVQPGAQAGTNPITADLLPILSQREWQQRSPLLGFYTPLFPKNGVEVLLETEGLRSPAFVYHSYGRGRVALVSAGPLWRWKFLSEGNTLYDEMVSRLLDVLSRGEDTERFVLISRKNVYDSGEAPVFYAEIFNEKMQPVTGVPVTLEISRLAPEGEVPLSIQSMQRESNENPRYKTVLPTLPPGKYQVRGGAQLPGRVLASQPVEISVSEVSVEFHSVSQDAANLGHVASASGGSFANWAGDVAGVAGSIAMQSRLVDASREMSLRTNLIVFSIILVLLSIEWLLRKRRGMI